MILTGILLLVACNEQQISNASESALEVVDATAEPKKISEDVEQQMLERINTFQFIHSVSDVKKGQGIEGDFNLILNVVRSYPEEVPIISQGEKYNSFYESYRPEQVNAAMLKYHGFEIDFEQYLYDEQKENQSLIFDAPYVYLASADYPGFLGHQEIVMNSIGSITDRVYTAQYQIRNFLSYEYEEATGKTWDFAYAWVPMEQWPKEMKQYMELDPTKYYAIFVKNEYGLALIYLGKEPLGEEETNNYLQSILDETIKRQVAERLNSFQFIHLAGEVKKKQSVQSDFNTILNLTRSFPEEVSAISQGKVYNSFYEWYSPETLNKAMLKYHGFEIDFKKYVYDKTKENQNIIFDQGYVYILSADYPGLLGYQTPVVHSIEAVTENGYGVEFQYKLFETYNYEEETGKVWDVSYTNIPMEKWPDEMKAYVKLERTTYYALFVENEFGLALAYLGKEPLEKEKAEAYLNSMQ